MANVDSSPDAPDASEDDDSFGDAQRMIERLNREIEAEEERQLAALDDCIVSTDRHELKLLREAFDREPGADQAPRDQLEPCGKAASNTRIA